MALNFILHSLNWKLKKLKRAQLEEYTTMLFLSQLMGFLPVEDQVHESKYMREHLRTIISKVSPDLLHIFGTEYPHSLVAAEEFNNPKKTVVNIQGLPSFYWMHFNNGIPYEKLKRFTIK